MTRPRLSDAPQIAADVRPHGRIRAQFGESAVWSPHDRGVWWLDMHGHAIIFTAEDGSSRLWKTPGPSLPWARALVLHENGGLLVALADTLALFDPVTATYTPLAIDLRLPPGHLFNDATVDSAGNLVIGTMLPGRGNDAAAILVRIDSARGVSLLAERLNTVNGLAVSPDGATLYFSDSWAEVRRVWRAAYNPASCGLLAAQEFVDFAEMPGKPDGAVIDSDGGYWIAAMGSPFVHRFDSDGRLTSSVAMPLDTPTRPALGAGQLFTTSGGLKGGEVDDGIKGRLLACPVAARGTDSYLCRVV